LGIRYPEEVKKIKEEMKKCGYDKYFNLHDPASEAFL
jgi:hypothetical protein